MVLTCKDGIKGMGQPPVNNMNAKFWEQECFKEPAAAVAK